MHIGFRFTAAFLFLLGVVPRVHADSLRAYPVENPLVTSGEPAYAVTAPDSRAVFSLLNGGTDLYTVSLVVNLSTLSDWAPNDQVVVDIFSSVAAALMPGQGDLWHASVEASIDPDPLGSGGGENLNYLATLPSFSLSGTGPGVLWMSLSFDSDQNPRLVAGNVSDPLGLENYLVTGSTVETLSDLGAPGHAWAVQVRTAAVPEPATIYALTQGLFICALGYLWRRRRSALV